VHHKSGFTLGSPFLGGMLCAIEHLMSPSVSRAWHTKLAAGTGLPFTTAFLHHLGALLRIFLLWEQTGRGVKSYCQAVTAVVSGEWREFHLLSDKFNDGFSVSVQFQIWKKQLLSFFGVHALSTHVCPSEVPFRAPSPSFLIVPPSRPIPPRPSYPPAGQDNKRPRHNLDQ
jgi:hypothetical protein